MTTVNIQDKKTNEIKIAVYAPNKKGNKQYNVDGIFLKDNIFDKLYKIIN